MSQRKADAVLIMVTVFWGSSYLFMKTGLSSMGTFNLIALRFMIAFALTGLLFYHRLLRADAGTLFRSFLLGINLLLVFTFIMFGLRSTSTSHAGFLVSLTVIFVPILSSVFLHQRLKIKFWLGIGIALLGIGLLTLNRHFGVSEGDVYCILGALFNAVYILSADRFTKCVDSIALGVWQLGFTGLFAGILSIFLETPKLPQTPEAWISVLGLGILCSAVGYIFQMVAQKFTTSVHAGLIFTLEPVFAAFFAYLFAGENLSARGYIGACLVLLSVVISEMNIKKRRPSVSVRLKLLKIMAVACRLNLFQKTLVHHDH
ncbi:DMT family transporter [Sporolactobacillus putidus]|uniref:Multidrug transporter n=1 Tax=Sporolactobacillus putidus TaxID=492735 RepID=A0A917RYN5_9BACL|nr:DMT family transporter [Sporolactobacillus putidus]GGL46471.1 multidrug transporter [Sporolactobacillus putidus]